MKAPILCTLAAVTLASCGLMPLNTRGEVLYWSNRPDSELKTAADGLEGLTLTAAEPSENWSSLIRKPSGAPDLILTDLNHDVVKAAADGLLADLAPYRSRLKAPDRLWPGLKAFSEAEEFPQFIPASVYLWQLAYSRKATADLSEAAPGSLEALERNFARLKEKGVIPLSLGASFGWPALAWISALDIRMNGPEAYGRLLRGRRHFDDPTFLPVYRTLARWRDLKYIDPEAGVQNWPEALNKVKEGKAAYMFSGTSAFSRLGAPEEFPALPLPQGESSENQGDLAVIQGFLLSAEATKPEAALALADAYILAGAPGITSDAFRIASLVPGDGSPGLPEIKERQVQQLRKGSPLLPQLDRILPPQAAYDSNQAMIRFFTESPAMTAEQLSEVLGKISRGRNP